jgi:hypothetical protein
MIREQAENLLKRNRELTARLHRSESQRDLYLGLALAGWVCFVAALALPI